MSVRSLTFAALLASAGFAIAACNDGPTAANALPPDVFALKGGTGGVCLGEDGTPLPTAPRSARVDLAKPTFSDPTTVTNPLFPVGQLSRVLLLGAADGVPLRVETTLLPGTRTIDLRPRPVETLVSQYIALLGGRIHEAALDFYAQDDDGAVWYFGEDVFNYEDGVIIDTEGTWLAGTDGPFGMIMPADPQVGDVWRPENICDLVFEEVTAVSTGVTVDGPRGPVSGALVVQELHMDGTFEDKVFAPGYGEFSTGAGADLEAVALAVPIDALVGPMPAELSTLYDGATEVFDAAQVGNWAAASATVATMTTVWTSFQAGGVPPMLDTQMSDALAALITAVNANSVSAARQAAIHVARATLDLQLRHRALAEVDVDHLDLWARQVLVDVAAGDQGAVLGDVATMQWIRDRLAGDVTSPDLARIDAQLGRLRTSVAGRGLTAAADAAAGLRSALTRTRVSLRP